jgi:antitoxin HicB
MTEEEGGGYLVTFPELLGCMSDGETIEEAIVNAADAEKEWLLASESWDKMPEKPGRFVTRMPQWMYRGLQYSATREGVSMNTLIVSMLAKELGERQRT